MSLLDPLAAWPADHVSAAVITAAGVVETFGATDRVYELASVTKLLVAEASLVAVEEGAVELNDAAGPPGATIAHLLAHASGLAFATHDVEAPAGERRIYSSAGFEVLADTIESETGIPFAQYVGDAVFGPLGMASSELVGSAGHGARSSVDDLAAFARELLAPTLLAPETSEQATTVWFPGLDGFVPGYGRHRPNDWGLGFEIRSNKSPHWTGASNSPRTFGHFGQSGTFLWVDPDLQAACVVLTDRDFGAWAKPLWSEFNDRVVIGLRS